MQQFRSTIHRHRLGKMTENIFFLGSSSLLSSLKLAFSSPALSCSRSTKSIHFDEYSCGRLIFELISLAMRRLFYRIINPKVETTGANKSSIKPLPSCTRTRFFVLLGKFGLIIWQQYPLIFFWDGNVSHKYIE